MAVQNRLQLLVPVQVGRALAAVGVVAQQRCVAEEDMAGCVPRFVQMSAEPVKLPALREQKPSSVRHALQADHVRPPDPHGIGQAAFTAVNGISFFRSL